MDNPPHWLSYFSEGWLNHQPDIYTHIDPCIYANIGGILMVNVTIYSIHGSDGIYIYCCTLFGGYSRNANRSRRFIPLFTVRRGLEICTAWWSYQGSKGHVFANMARFRRKIWIKTIKLWDFEVITLVFMGKMMMRQWFWGVITLFFDKDNIFTQQLFKRRQLYCRLSKSTPRTPKGEAASATQTLYDFLQYKNQRAWLFSVMFIGPQAVQGGIWGEGTVGKYGVMWSAICYASPSFFWGFLNHVLLHVRRWYQISIII